MYMSASHFQSKINFRVDKICRQGIDSQIQNVYNSSRHYAVCISFKKKSCLGLSR